MTPSPLALRRLTHLVFLSLLFTGSCSPRTEPGEEKTPRASTDAPAGSGVTPLDLVSAHTSGTLSRHSALRVVLKRNLGEGAPLHQPLESGLFEFTPPVSGEAHFTSPNEVVFQPSTPLTSGEDYSARLHLERLTSEPASPLDFSFSVIPQAFEITLEGLEPARSDDSTAQVLQGTLTTADHAEPGKVRAMLKFAPSTSAQKVRWNHSPNGRRHTFTLSGIQRGEHDRQLTLNVNGDPIGVDHQHTRTVEVPGLSNFSVRTIAPLRSPEQLIEVRFSDPLKKGQNLSGLISVGQKKLRFHTEGNIVSIYSLSPWGPSETVSISPGIRNTQGRRLNKGRETEVFFVEQKPALRFAHKGNIVPSEGELMLPLEVVNLRSVKVEVIRINAASIPQFLQVNSIDSDHELNRVGRPIWSGRVDLPNPEDNKKSWRRVGLKLGDLPTDDKNGIYHLRVSFGPQDITYKCPNLKQLLAQAPKTTPQTDDDQEQSYWNLWNDQGWYENYRNRTNPCHPGYYQEFDDHKIRIQRNLFASTLGIIAKQGAGNTLTLITTNLRTGEPLPNVQVKVLDYQQALINQGVTDERGVATLPATRKPFLVVASKAGQQGFLRLPDGGSLSLSSFDVAGIQVSDGLKGYIYGERGVWRPGDTLYLSFILFDPEHRLPSDHPVKFELRNSRGQVIAQKTKQKTTDGFYTFQPRTAPEAQTGNYNVKITVGNAVFEKTLKVETVIPNRLKVDLRFPGETLVGLSPQIEGKLASTWLHGAIAKSLRADVHLSLHPQRTTFDRFPDYSFDDLSRRLTLSPRSIFNGTLDPKGHGLLSHSLKIKQKPAGMLNARFETRIFEPSGAFSTAYHSLKMSPYERYIGIKPPKGDKTRGMLLTDTSHTLELVGLTPDGDEAATTQVDVALYKIHWRWWWEGGEEHLADYAGTSSHTPIQKGVVTLKGGRGQWNFEVKYPAWGRYLLTATDRNGGHRAAKIVYIDWPGWAGKGQKENPGGAHILSLSTDREEYRVGEEVTLSIPTSQKGQVLVSLESSSRVLQTTWVQSQPERTRYTFKVTPEMAPNIYAHVTLLQPHQQSQNDLPIRLYGVTPIRVVAPETRLSPVITSADTFEPGTEVAVQVREETGQAMTYTLALVDEGLLGLTGFKTPTPWSHFYQRESLGVKTWDLFDRVAGAYGGKLENLVAIGGGAGGGGSKPQKRAERFPPFVQFKGPFSLAAGETQNRTLQIPQYLGAGRIMVVAASGERFGSAAKSVTIKKPLMLLATLPRVLGPEEEVNLPISVFALLPQLKDVQIEVTTEGPLKVKGPARKTLIFEEPGDQIIGFKLKVDNHLGVGKVHIKAHSEGETSEQTLEIEVRHPLLPRTTTLARALQPGETWTASVLFPGIPGTNSGTLEVAKTPPLNLGQRLDSLLSYPHGCAEQTTSRAFPQLYLSGLLKLTPEEDQEVRTNIEAAVNKLARYQQPGGGFGYWQGQSRANDWSTSYIGHFLIEAQNAGFLIPEGMMTKWLSYQRQVAMGWRPDRRYERSSLMQAYRLYTLALGGTPALSAMNRFKENGTLPPAAKWRLASAYALAGQPETADALVEGLSPEPEDYLELSGTFGSSLRDHAMILDTLITLGKKRESLQAARTISEKLSSGKWFNTQATAFSLVALSRFGLHEKQSGPIDVEYSFNDAAPKSVTTATPLTRVGFTPKETTPVRFRIKNRGKIPVFVNVLATGLPKLGEERASERGLEMTVKYFDSQKRPIKLTAMEQGTDFRAEVTLKNTSRRPLPEMALSHLFPSGWELHNERLSSPTPESSGMDYQDIRDDRVYTYFSLNPGESRTFRTRLNASYAGRFYLPAVSAEAMYDRRIHSTTPGNWVEVVAPKTTH